MCLHRYRKTWNIQTSLIEVFATFILLSSVKVLGVSFQILSLTKTYDVEGKSIGKIYPLYGKPDEYLPFAFLAVTVSFIFVLLPLFLLAIYPCGCFQRCLNHCGGRCQPLHVFMDAFQGCYRTHPRDLRCFSAFYLLLRVVLLAQVALFPTYLLFFTSGIFAFAGAGVMAIFQPYKEKRHNTVDTVLLLLMGVYFISYYALIVLTAVKYPLQWDIAAVCEGLAIALAILYVVLLLLWRLLHLKILTFLRYIKALTRRNRQGTQREFISSFNRDDNSDVSSDLGYPPLLQKSMMPTY
jgi:hypothetical protein